MAQQNNPGIAPQQFVQPVRGNAPQTAKPMPKPVAKPLAKPVTPSVNTTTPQVQAQPTQSTSLPKEKTPWYATWWVWTIVAAVIIAVAIGAWIFLQ